MFSSADIPLLVVLIALLLLAVFLAAAEAALLRITEIRARALATRGDRRSARLLHLVERLPQVLNLILLLALLAQIGSATITGILAQRWFGNIGVTIASIVLTIVLYIYGEAIPKTYAVRHAERTARFVTPTIAFLERVFRPVVSLLVWVADIQMPGKGVTTSATVTEDELRLLAVEAADEGEITEVDRHLIDRAFRFGDREVDDIMVPRPDVVAVDGATPLAEALLTALEAGHRRLPVYAGDMDNIDGVVRLRDLIEARDRGETDLAPLIYEPLVVPESKKVSGLLADMQEQNNHMAVVVDEYGVTVGIVTIEDVAEELLGSISDDPARPDFRHVGPGRWDVAGSLPVEDLAAELGMEIPDGEWNTAAGLMLGVAGRLLRPGASVEVDGFEMKVQTVRRRRITRISIRRPVDSPLDR
ncbi:MAG TPA: hemolysin family protein [Acidimicrobiia bacterium]|nr:hemolysin family protein [Acidimicrobiia bacterium]